MESIRCISVVACFLLLSPVCQSDVGHCSSNTGNGRSFTLSVNHKWDQLSGDWVRNFVAQNTQSGNTKNGIELEARDSVIDCQGMSTVRLEVTVRGKWNDSLIFHKRHGKNVVVVEGGRTAQKLDADDRNNAVLFTNRPLRNNELFEIRLEKKVNITGLSLGIGVTSYSPDEIDITPVMHTRNESWIMKNGNIYQNNEHLKHNYGKTLNSLKFNDRAGVMRRADGELHFYINGVDQGSAAIVPEGVYGVLELWNDANRARIVY